MRERWRPSIAAAALRREAKQDPKKRWWQYIIDVQQAKLLIFSLEVGGWGGAVALVLSITTLYLTFYDKVIIVPQPEMRGPEDVNIVCDTRQNAPCMSGDSAYIRANPIILRNLAPGDHPFTVDTMDVAVDLLDAAGKPVSQVCLDWQFFSNITTVGSEEQAAGPIQVRDSSPFSKEIEFYPRRNYLPDGTLNTSNFLPFRSFEEQAGAGKISSARFTFEAEVLGSKIERETVSCEYRIDSDFQAHAAGSFAATLAWEKAENARAAADPDGDSLPVPSEEYHEYGRECVAIAPQPPRCQ